nr:flagellar basal body rod C-terminal domain-containing protein [Candidatus Kryptonium thompsoni]
MFSPSLRPSFLPSFLLLPLFSLPPLSPFPPPPFFFLFFSPLFSLSSPSRAPLLDETASAIQSKIMSGVLEQSNVDLAEEFTRMIIAQRGFQANARVITASDEFLQEITNLKR